MTRKSLLLCMAVTVALLSAIGPLAHAQPYPPVDHFKTYLVNPQPFSGAMVNLTDQFGSQDYIVNRLEFFANPVSKNSEPVVFPRTHLSWWQIDSAVGEPSRTVIVRNQFGEYTWTIFRSRYLLAPALKNPQPGEQIPVNINHFKCYDASGPPVNIDVTLDDQFGHRVATVVQPIYLCTPTQKKTQSGQIFPMVNPDAHLACYRIQPPQTYGIPVIIQDQFFGGQITMTQDLLLCVPSEKHIPVPTQASTWGRVKGLFR